MSDLAIAGNELAPASADMLARVEAAEEKMRAMPQIELVTEHLLHAGMYARTVRLAAGVAIIGVTIKVPTQLIIHGDCMVLAGDEWKHLKGFNVIPGHAGRKGVFVTASATEITMIFPTSAQTVEEAEAEFTDEADRLLSRRQEAVTLTGSEPCQE